MRSTEQTAPPEECPAAALYRAAAAALRPPPRLSVADWAAQHRVLSPVSSKEPGRWNNDRAPYLVEPMERLSAHDPCEVVVLMFGAQLGKTELGNNWLGYLIDLAPGPAMVVMPTTEEAREYVQQRLDHVIADAPVLRDRIAAAKRGKTQSDTTLRKTFPGGFVVFRGGNSPARLAAKPIRYLFLDEVDRYPHSVGGEGDPVDIALQRTVTYGRGRKVLLTSTPTVTGESRIYQAWRDSDQQRYFVPCPSCGRMTLLRWRDIRFAAADVRGSAAWHCPFCGAPHRDASRGGMLAGGIWRPWIDDAAVRDDLATAIVAAGRPSPADDWELSHDELFVAAAQPTGGRVRGYALSQLYAPVGFRAWGEIAADHVAARHDPVRLQVWVNTQLGETWDAHQQDDAARPHEVAAAFSVDYPRPVPDEVAVLTAAVDVQDNRLELLVAGWDSNRAPWHVHHQELYGSPADDGLWAQLDALLTRPWDGLRITQTCIDAGGHHPDEAYQFCRQRFDRRVVAIRGSTNAAAPIWPLNLTEIKRGNYVTRAAFVGVHAAKTALFGRLRLSAEDQGRFRFPRGLPEEYYLQLLAEREVVAHRGGVAVRRFEQTRPRNEVLDLWVYALAGLHALINAGIALPEWHHARHAITPPAPMPPRAPAAPRKNWFRRD